MSPFRKAANAVTGLIVATGLVAAMAVPAWAGNTAKTNMLASSEPTVSVGEAKIVTIKAPVKMTSKTKQTGSKNYSEKEMKGYSEPVVFGDKIKRVTVKAPVKMSEKTVQKITAKKGFHACGFGCN